MHYGEIKNCDIANGEGVRVSLFVSGCTNCCEDCFQPETWDFNYGKEYTEETENEILKMLGASYITGLTLLGGEPFEPSNQEVLVKLLRKVREAYPNKTVWSFTGFTYEKLNTEGEHCHTENTEEMLSMIDILVDGKFDKNLKNITLRFRGSENQRIIDLNKTRETGELTMWEGMNSR